jgi:hypothetical protein
LGVVELARGEVDGAELSSFGLREADAAELCSFGLREKVAGRAVPCGSGDADRALDSWSTTCVSAGAPPQATTETRERVSGGSRPMGILA